MTDPGAREDAEDEGFVASVREALRGTERDLTAISLGRAVLLLAIPTMLEMSMESLLVIVDIFFVSRLGTDAVATVGLAEALMSPVYALAMGLSAAATATIARQTGEKDKEAASRSAVQVIGLAAVLSILFGALGGLSATHLLAWMGATAEVTSVGAGYTRVMLAGTASIFLLFVVNAVFRSAGDAALAMRSLWLANGLNMLLTPALVFGVGPIPRLGLVGAAIAMTGSRAVGVVYQLVMLGGGKRRIAVALRHLVVLRDVILELVRVGTPAALQVLIETASWLGLVAIVARHGGAALAGYTIAMRISIFALLPAWGLAGASATLVGQNLGAKRPERARDAVWRIARYNAMLLGAFAIVFVAAPGVLTRFFTSDAETLAVASQGLRIVAIGFVAFASGMVSMQSLNGAGDTKTPMVVNLVSFWGFKIPLAWVLSEALGWGPTGVFTAITLAYIAQSIAAMLCFRRASRRWVETASSS